MKALATGLFIFLLCCCAATAQTKFDLCIAHANIIDGTGAAMLPDAFVYISNGRIARITKQRLANTTSAQEIDAAGKFLIPGLIEAHAHPASVDVDPVLRKNYPHSFKTMIHYGITTVMLYSGSNGSYARLQELRNSAAEGQLVSPRILYSSPFFTKEGAHPMKMYPSPKWIEGETYYDITDTSVIKMRVEEAKAKGALGIKLIVEDGPAPPFVDRLPAATIGKVVQEAHAAHLPVFAHISDRDEAALCINAGVDNMVHFAGVRLNWAEDAALVKRFAKAGGSWVTTMMLVKSLIYYRLHPEWLQRPAIKQVYDSAEIAGLLQPGMADEARFILKSWSGSEHTSLEDFVKPIVQDLLRLDSFGVNVVAGTDVGGDNFILPGLSLHEEMEMLQMGGMPAWQIIKMATYNGAKMLNILNDVGSLQEGKYADMILLSKNPLADIRNTQSIVSVFKEGKLQPRVSK